MEVNPQALTSRPVILNTPNIRFITFSWINHSLLDFFTHFKVIFFTLH